MGHTELVLALFAAVVTIVSSADVPPGGYYRSKYDYVDVEDLLNHKRLVQHYATCLLNRGPCPPEGADLKRILPEALETNCLRCTEKQKDIILKVIKRIKEEYPRVWKELTDLYDPSELRISKFEQTYSNKISVEDQANLLTNRFSEDAAANNVVPAVSPSFPDPPSGPSTSFPYPSPSPTTSTRPFVSQTASSTVSPSFPDPPLRPATSFPYPAPSPTTSTTTVRPLVSQTASSTVSTTTSTTTTSRPPSSTINSKTNQPSFLSIWNIQTKPPTYGWRPSTDSTTQQIFFRPLQTIQPLDIPLLKLGSIADIGNKVLQAGSQVAGMVLSTVQRLVGQ